MTKLILKTENRKTKGKENSFLREKGIIPAVIYGHGLQSRSIQVNYLDFEKIFKQAGESSLIDLEIEKEKPVKTLIQEVQREPVSDKICHIDFRQIKADEKVSVEVGLKFVGESPAVKELGGVLIHGSDKIHIECLPDDLIHEIEIDISEIKKFGDAIRIKDLGLSNKIKILSDPEALLIQVEEPKTEEEPVVEVASTEPERIGEKEKIEAELKNDNKEKNN